MGARDLERARDLSPLYKHHCLVPGVGFSGQGSSGVGYTVTMVSHSVNVGYVRRFAEWTVGGTIWRLSCREGIHFNYRGKRVNNHTIMVEQTYLLTY